MGVGGVGGWVGVYTQFGSLDWLSEIHINCAILVFGFEYSHCSMTLLDFRI